MPVAPADGTGDVGAEGAAASVVNDHTMLVLDPLLFLATTCQ